MIQDDPRFYLYWAWALLLSGRTVPIESTITIAEQRANSLDMFDELRGDIAAVMAYEASRRGDMEMGFEKAHVALEWLAEDNYSVRGVMAFVLGGIYYMRQDWPRAIAAMQEAGRLGEISKNLNVAVSALSAMGRIQLSQGELKEAEKTFTRALDLSKGRSGQPLPIASSAYSGLAKLNFMRRNLEEARRLAQKGKELAEQWVNVDSQVGCLLTLAQINHAEGNPDEAQLALEEAKWLAGKHVLTPDAPESIAEIEALLQTKPPRDSTGGPLIDPLSKREQEVLSLFAQGLTNQEVAERLFISLGTVKAHSSHIYQKLNARSRTDAVLKARQLGLL
jgi:ATP/maltotriose-dependent transcriptional regulator MalT